MITQDAADAYELILVVDAGPLQLQDPSGKLGSFTIDFANSAAKYRRAQASLRSEILARAVLPRGQTGPIQVIDATAGWGRDAIVMAQLGCHVTLIEKSPIVSAMLDDAVERARQNPDLSVLANRLRTVPSDSERWITELSDAERPDVIYIDPMYPSVDKRSLPRKDMQYLRMLSAPNEHDASQLLQIARAKATKRTVVKRPLKAPILSGGIPSSQLKGRQIRFDIYVTPNS